MKKLIFIALPICLLNFSVYAQRPVVSGISPQAGTVKTTVVISGSNLPAGTNAHVQFGAVQGNVLEATTSEITTEVPAGASFRNLTVTNRTSGLSGESRNPFMLAFGGSTFSTSKFAAETNIGLSNYGLFDLCSCDFNNDGKVDAATSHISNTTVTLFRNTTNTPNALSFTKTSTPTNALGRNIICGDVDGDTRPDIIISGYSQNANRVYVLRNLSTAGGALTFAGAEPLSMNSGSAAQLALKDLNADGRPEIIVTNLTDPTVSIFINASTPGTISFNSQAQDISITGPTNTHGISTTDFDGDGLIDLAITPFQGSNVYLLRNTSSGNSISFTAGTSLTTPAGLVNIVSADLNGDGKSDLATTNYYVTSNHISVWLNTSSSGSIQFNNLTQYTSGSRPWGIVAGDIDGNGKVDLAVHHQQSASFYILSNTSSNGALQLTENHVNTGEVGRYLNMVDYDGDAKPDLSYTGTTGNNFRILHNKHEVVARLSHTGTITLCPNQTIVLQATKALGVTYRWTRNGTALSATTDFISVTEAGDYTVTITSAVDAYASTSETLRVVTGSGSGATISLDPITPVCVGGSTDLRATAIDGATYVWSGPNSFTATTTAPSYTLTNVQTSAAGSYSVVVSSGDCQFTPGAQSLSVYQNPQPQVTASATSFCAGTTITLQAQTGFSSYQWKFNGANYSGAGATNASISTTNPGSYAVEVTNSAGCTGLSNEITLTQTQPPVANFTMPASACLGLPVTFQNTSTYASGQNPTYRWTFGDGGVSTEENPTHYFTLLGTFTVNLTVTYGSQGCSNTMSKTIAVVPTPNLELLADGPLTICPGDSVLLHIAGDATSAEWSNGTTGLELWAKDAGSYSASILTSAGCVIEKSIEVTHLPQPVITISASSTSINIGESVQLTAGGGLQYQWEATTDISDLYSHTVSVQPLITTTYKVTGWNENSCWSGAEVTITVDNSLRISPPKIFVPQVDGFWTISNIELYPEISLSLVNSLGRSIFEAKPYANNWDGTERGNPIEPGVYYYIFKDAAGKVVKTGSITLLR